MHPMSFMEFIEALGKSNFVSLIKEHRWEELSVLSNTLQDLLRQYYYVGGMPEVVSNYISSGNLQDVRKKQKQILSDYEYDFSKHIPNNLFSKVVMVWNSIPSQLARENKKFLFGAIKKGARAKDFEDAIQWLIDAGLIFKAVRVRSIERPLKFYEDISAFKLFISDVGLLGAKTDSYAKEVITGANYFSEYKGAFTEQFVAQELSSLDYKIYYFSKENSTLKIDFMIQKNELYPIEVKAEENLKSKCLKTVYEQNPRLKPCRFSMSGYKVQDQMANVPLYLCREWIMTQE